MNLTSKQKEWILDYVHDFLIDYYQGGYIHPGTQVNDSIGANLDIREYDIYKVTEKLDKTQFNSGEPAFISHPLLERNTYTKEEEVNKRYIGSRFLQLIPIKDTDYVLLLNGYRARSEIMNSLVTTVDL